jgi:hypothetical protein
MLLDRPYFPLLALIILHKTVILAGGAVSGLTYSAVSGLTYSAVSGLTYSAVSGLTYSRVCQPPAYGPM